MKVFRSLSTFFSVVFLSGCTTAPVAVYTMGARQDTANYKDIETTDYQKKVFSSYCQKGKQVKKLAYNLRFVKPKLPKGTALDNANELIEKILKISQCSVQTSFIQLSQHCQGYLGCHNFYKTSDSIEKVTESGKEITFDERTTQYCQMGSCTESGPMRPAFVFIDPAHPIMLIFEKTERKSSSQSWGNWYASKYGDDGSDQQAFLIELAALRRGYTMLITHPAREEKWMEHVSNQNDICTSEKWSNGSYKFLSDNWSIDNSTLSPSDALVKKDSIWKRYLLSNSTIKEAVSNDAQVVNYEINLDLNGLCTYGRHVDDLLSY